MSKVFTIFAQIKLSIMDERLTQDDLLDKIEELEDICSIVQLKIKKQEEELDKLFNLTGIIR